VEESRDRILKALNNVPGAERDVVALNAGAAIYAAGITDTLADGVGRARTAIASGAAMAKLEALRAFG
jgi:anthranilate phosphoribosyltransferase